MIRTRKAPARFLSALLCLVMMLTLLPTVALVPIRLSQRGEVTRPSMCRTLVRHECHQDGCRVCA